MVEYRERLNDYAPHPAIRLAEDHYFTWHGKYYPDPPQGLGGLQWVGVWTKLMLPWDAPAPQAGDVAVPVEVLATIEAALEYYRFEMENACMYDEATDKFWLGNTEAVAAHDVALAWLKQQPRPATGAQAEGGGE